MTAAKFPEPAVDPEEYKPGFLLIWVAFIIPPVFLAIDLCRKSPAWFAPSGALALFLVAFVELRQLSRLQLKHFRNAERAAKHEAIQGLSKTYQALEKRVFWAGLYGTGIWAFGDKLINWLLRMIAA